MLSVFEDCLIFAILKSPSGIATASSTIRIVARARRDWFFSYGFNTFFFINEPPELGAKFTSGRRNGRPSPSSSSNAASH
jgi:hypothetical protein